MWCPCSAIVLLLMIPSAAAVVEQILAGVSLLTITRNHGIPYSIWAFIYLGLLELQLGFQAWFVFRTFFAGSFVMTQKVGWYTNILAQLD